VNGTAATVVAEGSPSERVVRVSGEVDLANVETVHHQIADEIAAGGHMTVDLSALDYLDSSGVRMLDELMRRAAALQCELAFALPQNAVCRRVLELTLPGLPEATDARGPSGDRTTDT
jgi:anti-anti-sigma factor